MREFITKVSDYLNEMRNNPDRREDRLAVVIIGAAAMVVIVLLLLILWGHIAKERERKEALNAEIVTAVHEEDAAAYMAQGDGSETMNQEYLTNIDYLSGRVEELLEAMTLVEQNLSETIEQYREEDTALGDQITSLHTEVTTIIQNLKETQTKLYDLTDIVQIINEETIPIIREQIADIRSDLDRVNGDITNLYTKIAALEQEDIKLWAGIANVENLIGNLETRALQYRYDAESNTLYLQPGGE